MSALNVGIKGFEDALRSLNEKLAAEKLIIEIRAVGGYALLFNKLRNDGYTVDVDTLTADYPVRVKELIREVAVEKGLEEDWINNDAYSLHETMGIYNEIEWLEDRSFSNIKLYVADLNSLLKLKARAIHYGGLVPRVTDKTDLLDILSAIGIRNITEVETNPAINDLMTKYERCYNFLKDVKEW